MELDGRRERTDFVADIPEFLRMFVLGTLRVDWLSLREANYADLSLSKFNSSSGSISFLELISS
jgi:hypothetical protein